MESITASLVKVGDILYLPDGPVVVTRVQEVAPKCLAQTKIFWEGGEEVFCNYKSFFYKPVVPRKKNGPRK